MEWVKNQSNVGFSEVDAKQGEIFAQGLIMYHPCRKQASDSALLLKSLWAS